MTQFILIHAQTGDCYDVVTETFPVAHPLVWVDITAVTPLPQHGSTATLVDGAWIFTGDAA